MVEITKTTPSTIKVKNIGIADGNKVQMIMNICHKYKHLYKEGFPCGRKTRKTCRQRIEKWANCPEICFTYLITIDAENHNLTIGILVSDLENLRKRYTEREIEYHTQMYVSDIADEILATI